jgi:hypothetical protein
MQFTLRDFFWLTIVIGLVIGILIEHADVRAMHGAMEKARWWEWAARQMGKQAAKEGTEPYFRELDSAGFKNEEGLILIEESQSFWIPVHSHPDAKSITGHRDLDLVLLLLVAVAPISLLVGLVIRRKFPEQGKAYAKLSVRVYHWMTPVTLTMMFGFCVAYYFVRQPFSATLWLCGIAFLVYYYVQNRNLTLTPEIERQIEEKYEQPLNMGSWFKVWK